jgi:hypothetical protein
MEKFDLLNNEVLALGGFVECTITPGRCDMLIVVPGRRFSYVAESVQTASMMGLFFVQQDRAHVMRGAA